MKAVRVAKDHWNFETTDGTWVTPLGGNILDDQHPGQGTLFQKFDAAECDRRLGKMAELGLNCLRQAIGVNEVFDPDRGWKAAGLKNWDTFISLAEKHGIYLMPVGGYIRGNDWFDVDRLSDFGRQLDWECAFWEGFVGHFRGHPAIWAWDLRNELLFSTQSHSVAPEETNEAIIANRLKLRWPWWLETRYGTVKAMNQAYGTAYESFSAVEGSISFREDPFDLCAFDFRNYLNFCGHDWCKRQCDVIRAVDPEHMIVSGNNGWLAPDLDLWLANGFHNHALHDLFDFVTFHPYPAWQCGAGKRGDPLDGGEPLDFWLSSCIGSARLDFYNKPVVLQEFGWYGGGASRFLDELPYRSEEEHAEYTRRITDALIPHVNGFLNWPTFDMPASRDISNHGGIFRSDGTPKALANVYRSLVNRLTGERQIRARANTQLTFSLLGLYTSRSYQDRMWNEVHAAVTAGDLPDFRFI